MEDWLREKKLKLVVGGVIAAVLARSLMPTIDWSSYRSEKVQQANIEHTAVQKSTERRFAILVNSSLQSEGYDFEREIEFAYRSLLAAGFDDKNIYVLQGDGKNKEAPFVNSPATYESFRQKIRGLEDKISETDGILFYFTNHGQKKHWYLPIVAGESVISFKDKWVTESELKSDLSRLNANYRILVFTTCYGGGFAEKFGFNSDIGISASSSAKAKHIPKNANGVYFDMQFFSAIGGRNFSGEKIDSDKNNDGKVSLEEVFDYAVGTLRHTKPGYQLGIGKDTPQLRWQNVQPSEIYMR